MRLTSANTESTTRTATVTIGGVSANFAVTTADMTPANFTFTAQTGVALSTLTASNGPTISGIDTAVNVSISGQGSPQFRIYTGSSWGAWRTSPTTVESGDRVQVRLTSAGSGNTTRTATLTVGSMSRNFSVTTTTQVGSMCSNFSVATLTEVKQGYTTIWGEQGRRTSTTDRYYTASTRATYAAECKTFCESFADTDFCQVYFDTYGSGCMSIKDPSSAYSIRPGTAYDEAAVYAVTCTH